MSIHDKILQLRKVIPENGATEAETITAIELANRLMEKHRISEEDLMKASFSKDMSEGSWESHTKQLDPAAKLCSVAISEFCEVSLWVKRDVRFFGFHADVAMAEFLFKLISGSMKRAWKEYLAAKQYNEKVSHHTRFWSFHAGFAQRINQKLREMIYDRTKSGSGLVALKSQTVELALKEVLNITLENSRKTSFRVTEKDVSAGYKAGDAVNLSRPLQERSETKFIE